MSVELVALAARALEPLVDGREELTDEIRHGDSNLRAYLAAELADLPALPRLRDGVSAALRPDAASQARGDLIVVPRLRAIGEAAVAGAPSDPLWTEGDRHRLHRQQSPSGSLL